MSITSARKLARTPIFSLTVALTLGFGVGALILTFGVVNAALFRQPPFPQAEHLALLYIQRNPEGEPTRRERWSFARFELLRESQQSFEHVASYSPGSITISGSGSDAELAQVERVSASYFPLLRVGAAARAAVHRVGGRPPRTQRRSWCSVTSSGRGVSRPTRRSSDAPSG